MAYDANGWWYEWTSGYPSPSSTDVYGNAQRLWDVLSANGWSDEAIAGCMGNFDYESGGTFNIGQWQHGSTVGDWDNNKVGLGLGQWTPPSKLADYCGGRSETACADGNKQATYTATNYSQWLTSLVNSNGYSSYYGFSGIPYFADLLSYAHDTSHTPEDMALSFVCIWERGGASEVRKSITTRQNNARKWYEEFANLSGHPIFITVEGNGEAWASYHEVEVHRAGQGDRIELGAVPNQGDTFITWEVIYPSTLTLEQPLTIPDNYFTMPADKVELKARFTGETPEPEPIVPPTVLSLTRKHHMPIWMYPIFR